MLPPKDRAFNGWARLRADEAVWPAQVITWLPLVSQAEGMAYLLFALFSAGPAFREHPLALLVAVTLPLLFMCLYGLAGAWIGARESRGIWLGIALFGWTLVSAVLSGRLLSFGALYAVVALVLIVRAGRAIGVRYLAPAA